MDHGHQGCPHTSQGFAPLPGSNAATVTISSPQPPTPIPGLTGTTLKLL